MVRLQQTVKIVNILIIKECYFIFTIEIDERLNFSHTYCRSFVIVILAKNSLIR